MCDFCHKHGEGKKWYLQAKNYSEDLLSDVKRIKFIQKFATEVDSLKEDFEGMKKLDRMPGFLRRAISWNATRKMKKIHFGQVVPIEDMERIFEFVNSIVRVACICRHVKLGQEQRYCYGISLGPNGGKMAEMMKGLDNSFLEGVYAQGMENKTKEEALAEFRKYEKQGCCHTIWTFVTPFIGGICNCDKADCLAMISTVTYQTPVMFRAEYVAGINWDLCNGCRKCMLVCQFGALEISAANKKVSIDPRRCYGCGICRSLCDQDAIALQPRSENPIAASYWQ
jgi:NAD-dependent dihydropyrimidine dehydrogenase PreA subunit